jgi:hypothetical protein
MAKKAPPKKFTPARSGVKPKPGKVRKDGKQWVQKGR